MNRASKLNVGDGFRRVLTFLEQTAQAQAVSLPAETDSLFDKGVLDSFGLLEFIGFIEETFDIKIPDEDLFPDRFATVEKIRQYVESRVGR